MNTAFTVGVRVRMIAVFRRHDGRLRRYGVHGKLSVEGSSFKPVRDHGAHHVLPFG